MRAVPKPDQLRQPFRPRSRLLQLLGDQLIGSPRLAVFELVKNAYDADAAEVTVRLEHLGTERATITVTDNGHGMSFETIRDVWLVPGDDYRERDREARIRSGNFRRLPLGEKGVGRFAVHKLGHRVEIVTRSARRKECHVSIDWSAMLQSRYLSEAPVEVTERPPQVFRGVATGTRVTVSALRDAHWTRRDIRDLHRQVMSIASPFRTREDRFDVTFEVPGQEDVLTGLPDAATLVDRAPWKFSFTFDATGISYDYEFRGVPGVRIQPRTLRQESQRLLVTSSPEPDDLDPASPQAKRRYIRGVATPDMLDGIGPISGTFFVFDRDKEILALYPEQNLLKRFLDQNGGVRVFRDGMRVYNYGEASDDWLGLDLSRVLSPTKRISRNIIVGSVDMSLKDSSALREKTNREGFVENDAFDRLRQIVLGVVSVLQTERDMDKRRLRLAMNKPPEGPRGIDGPLAQLRNIARKKGVGDEFEPALARVEQDYAALRDSFLRAGLSQVGLSLVFHEVERGVAQLARAIELGQDIETLREQAGNLQRVLETSSQLLRKAERKRQSLKLLVSRARDLSLIRFRLHRIQLECPALQETFPDVEAVFSFGLALGALTNILDNAIYWLGVAHPEHQDEPSGPRRRIYLDVLPDAPDGPTIVLADNGPGFRDPPQTMVEPFFSRRPDGMGLGLYYASLVMRLNEGRLVFPEPGDMGVPESYGGAVVGLVFKTAS